MVLPPLLMRACEGSRLFGLPALQSEFQQNWATLARSCFAGMDWSGVFAAGGSVLGCVLPNFAGRGFFSAGGRSIVVACIPRRLIRAG